MTEPPLRHCIRMVFMSQHARKPLPAPEPIAGRFAVTLFVCGIVGTGLLAVPVLASSAAYGIGEGCQWRKLGTEATTSGGLL